MPRPSSSIDDRERSIDVEDRSSRDDLLFRMCDLVLDFALAAERRFGRTRRGPSAGVAGSELGESSATWELKLDEYL